MKPLVYASSLLSAALLVTSGTAALAQESAAEPEVTLPPIEVTVDCDSSPEWVRVTNNAAKPVKLKNVGSTWQKRVGEPYKTRKTLKPGKSVVYSFGTGDKKGKRLSGSYIFDSNAAKEGVLVKTTKGNVKVGCSQGTNVPSEPEPEVEKPAQEPVRQPSECEPVDALELLATLAVEPEVDEDYERELFEHWIDVDGDGCDTRHEVLTAESLTPVTTGDGCSIEGGSWYSAAGGDTLTNPASLDINHVVPLKEAWASGAHAWTPEQREAFANDLTDERTLQAVSAGVNRQQGDADPASWLPVDRESACQFVADWVAIKASWRLAVDQTERDAIELTLENCPERTVTVTPRT